MISIVGDLLYARRHRTIGVRGYSVNCRHGWWANWNSGNYARLDQSI